MKKTLSVTLNYMEVKKNLSADAERVFTISLRNEPELAVACVGVAVYQVSNLLFVRTEVDHLCPTGDLWGSTPDGHEKKNQRTFCEL